MAKKQGTKKPVPLTNGEDAKAGKPPEAASCQAGLRKTGIDLIGTARWGTHFCLFYQTPGDILEILIPYFRAGLENNELCMWITSFPLVAEQATQAMAEAMPDFDSYLRRGQILIIPHTEWYLKDGGFDGKRVLGKWVSMLDHALLEGYEGLRLTGNTFWLEESDWNSFNEYEAAVDKIIPNYRMLAACTYSLEKCGPGEIFSAVATHQFAITRRNGRWEMIESSGHRHTRDALERERITKQSYLDLASIFVVALDADGIVTMVNRRGAEILGLPAKEIIGKNWFESFFPAEHQTEVKQRCMAIMSRSGHQEDYHEFPVLGASNEQRIIGWRYTPLKDSSGEITGMLGCGDDITHRKEVEKQLRLSAQLNQSLQAINMTINSTLEVRHIVQRVMKESAEALSADSVYISFKQGGNSWLIEHAYGPQAPEPGLTFETSESPVAWSILAKKKPAVYEDLKQVPDGALVNKSVNRSFLAVPLYRQSYISGIISFGFSQHRRFEPAQIDFAEKLALSVSLAIENARVYSIEQESRADIQSYATRLSLLHEIGLSLNQETDREKLLESILQSAAEMTSAGVGCMLLIKDDVTKLVSLYYAPWYQDHCVFSGDVTNLHKRINALMSDSHKNVSRIIDFDSLSSDFDMPHGHLSLRGLIIGRLSDTRGRILGYFMLSNKAGGAEFNPEDEEIISLLASQSSVALVSAENFEHEHSVAETLQSSLLPEVPDHEHVEVGLMYRSSSKEGKIGGDFYDFVELAEGKVAVVIGDVCGKGLAAANYTAMVKYTLQAYLAEGMSPGDCLTKLNASLCRKLAEEKFITLGLAILDTGKNRLLYSLAGHPLPIVAHVSGTYELEMPVTIPLGVHPDYSFPSYEAKITDNMSLLMYTDGIIEARSADGELYGRKRLKSAFASRPGLTAQAMAQKLVNRVLDFANGQLHDDVAVVVVQTREMAASSDIIHHD